MSDKLEPRGVNRREFLRRAAVTGATVAWAAPVVQTIGMGRAAAQSTTPCAPGISFIGINLVCNGIETCVWVKFDLTEGVWICDPGLGQVEQQCPGFTPCDKGDATDCAKVAVTGDQFQATVTALLGCNLKDVVVKGGQCCDVFTNVNQTSLTVRCPTQNC